MAIQYFVIAVNLMKAWSRYLVCQSIVEGYACGNWCWLSFQVSCENTKGKERIHISYGVLHVNKGFSEASGGGYLMVTVMVLALVKITLMVVYIYLYACIYVTVIFCTICDT